MKDKIHPKMKLVKVIDGNGNVFEVMSTLRDDEMRVEISSKTHPFYTGEQKILKTGAVDKFYARQQKSAALKK